MFARDGDGLAYKRARSVVWTSKIKLSAFAYAWGCLDVRKCVATLLVDEPGLKFVLCSGSSRGE